MQTGAAEGPLDAAALLLMRRDLTGLPQAVALAREAVNNVRQGLRWAIEMCIRDRGKRIFSVLETWRGVSMMTWRSFSVVRKRMMGGWITGTSAI